MILMKIGTLGQYRYQGFARQGKPRADPAGRFLGVGGATGRSSPNPTYPQIGVSPRISATLFWKWPKTRIN